MPSTVVKTGSPEKLTTPFYPSPSQCDLGDSVASAPALSAPSASSAPSAPSASTWPEPYYLEDNLRRVAPYFYTYKTWVKERWRGRKLLEVFETEFRDRPLAYYREAMESGSVAVNGKAVGPDHVLKNGELISHETHRHEPPVTSEPIQIIYEDEGMIVINKPAGVPVHPAGRYAHNSVTMIMKAERGPDVAIMPCNRLDRLTSGIMFTAKNAEAAERLRKQIMQRTVRKEYIARVTGEFPEHEVVCEQPILLISPRHGLNRVRANGKPARTVFKRLAYYPCPPADVEDGPVSATKARGQGVGPRDGNRAYSIVRCRPLTGRTHQIRVHLQFLGHPIQNDPIYANQRVWGLRLGVGDADGTENSDETIISRLSRMGKEDVAHAVAYYDEIVDDYNKKNAEKMSGELCDVCGTPLYLDPGRQELVLWLHSLRYEDADGSWSYTSPLPNWALPPAGSEGPKDVGHEVMGVDGESGPGLDGDSKP